jgi:hypothetical protein
MDIFPGHIGMQDEYQEAADLARMALGSFKQLDLAGDKAKSARDFKGAVRYWQEAEHALTDSLRQRQQYISIALGQRSLRLTRVS